MGVESGVIPALLFKTTSQHGIRPGAWHRSPPDLSALYRDTASTSALEHVGISLLSGFINRGGKDFAAPGFRKYKEKLFFFFGIVYLLMLLVLM